MVAESLTVSDLPEATCHDCLAFQPEKFDEEERILGACGLRPELGLVPENYPWCDQFRMKPSREGKVSRPAKKRAAGSPKSGRGRGVGGGAAAEAESEAPASTPTGPRAGGGRHSRGR